MISGTDIAVIRPEMTGRDAMGEPVFSESEETVPNVLWHPATTDEKTRRTARSASHAR